MNILIVIRYDETEMFADELIKLGVNVDKVYLSAKLKDTNSITIDELKLRYNAIVVDSHLSEPIVRWSPLNHGLYYFLFLEGKDINDVHITKADYMTIKVSDYENKTRDDWKQAAINFRESVAKSISSGSSVRT